MRTLNRNVVLTLLSLFLLCVIAFAQAPDKDTKLIPPTSPTSPTDSPAKPSLLLTPTEIDGLNKIGQDLQLQNQKEANAAQALIDTDSEDTDAIIVKALAYKRIAKQGRIKISDSFNAWLTAARQAHKCPDCTLSKDGKTLEQPPAAPAQATTPPAAKP